MTSTRADKQAAAYRLLRAHYDFDPWVVCKRTGSILCTANCTTRNCQIIIDVLSTGAVRWKVETMPTNNTPGGVVLAKGNVAKSVHHDLNERIIEADRRVLKSQGKGYTLQAQEVTNDE